ncbi:hypothetical protein [Persicobacter psychrovividus]|uniref:Uncharacterized protein n=1 Tax=Persicobacter psychrovividus TaxID=387638 RepID=A0ABN6LFF7_9BACT|nr:hypothetical protein PEPS_39960 [Persicobacter psychrovividus]
MRNILIFFGLIVCISLMAVNHEANTLFYQEVKEDVEIVLSREHEELVQEALNDSLSVFNSATNKSVEEDYKNMYIFFH